jgi:hypothetical protein
LVDLPVGEVRLELRDDQAKREKSVTIEVKPTTSELKLEL